MAFSRQQPLSPDTVDANKLVANMAEILSSTLGETRTKADANQLENAVLNLAVNARDAMPDGGKLTIETANAHIDEAYAAEHDVAPGQYVMIAVTDTGCGMPQEIIKKAFDPFFTTKPVGKGTSLGLSQAFGFARQSGGHLKIFSEVGTGTTMKIYLPRDYGTNDIAPHVKDESVPRGTASEAVLLVEDDASVREIHTKMLEELGYSVIAVDGPVTALKIVDERADIRLLLTDIVMAPMNGRKLADEVEASIPTCLSSSPPGIAAMRSSKTVYWTPASYSCRNPRHSAILPAKCVALSTARFGQIARPSSGRHSHQSFGDLVSIVGLGKEHAAVGYVGTCRALHTGDDEDFHGWPAVASGGRKHQSVHGARHVDICPKDGDVFVALKHNHCLISITGFDCFEPRFLDDVYRQHQEHWFVFHHEYLHCHCAGPASRSTYNFLL
jgi:CheY-like chemotaxis protein